MPLQSRTKTLVIALLVAFCSAACGRELAVLCPVNRSSDTVLLQGKGKPEVSTIDETLTTAYLWSNVASDRGFISCNGTTTSLTKALAGGTCLPVTSDASETKLCYDGESVILEALGSQSMLGLADNNQVTLCRSRTYQLQISWESEGASGELVVANTGCLALWGDNVDWLAGTEEAVENPSGKYAEAAGFPFSISNAAITSYSVVDQSNPCTSVAQGYSPGLTTQFSVAPSIPSPFRGALSLGSSRFTRCDCPNHQAAGLPWGGSPALNASFADNFGASFAGEFQAAQNAGVVKDLAAWKLVCLQFIGVAQLAVDGVLLIRPTEALGGAGYAEVCKAVQLQEGWHNLNALYAIGAQQALSAMRFFLIDAVGPEGGLDASSDINAITWQNNGSLCAISGNSQAACNQPYECCNFRTSYGCGSDLLAQDSSLAQPPPLVLPPSPVQYSLPANVTFRRGGLPGVTVTTPSTNATSGLPPPAASTSPAEAPQAATGPASLGMEPASAISPASQPAAPEPAVAPVPGPVGSQPASAVSPILGRAAPGLAPEVAARIVPGPLQPILSLPRQPQQNTGAPVQRSLPARSPPPAGVTPCTISAEPCWLYDAGSGTQMRMVSMSCNATSATELQYAAAVEFAAGQSTGWLSVTPTSGVAPASASIPFMVAINTTELAAGEHRAALQVSWTDGSQRSAVVSQDLTLILTGPGTARFIDVAARSDGTAAVAASASLDLPTSRTTIVTNLTLSSQQAAKNFTFQNSAFAGAIRRADSQINTTIALPSPYDEMSPTLSLNASFEVALPLGGYSSYTCGTVRNATAIQVPTEPQCQLFAVDMAFCGRRGLVTGQAQAQLLLVCSDELTVCADCFAVSGPPQASVQLLSYSSNVTASNAHHLLLTWPDAYEGQITLDLQKQRSLPGCGLGVKLRAGSSYTAVAAVEPLNFLVEESTPIRSASYELLHECSNSACSSAV